MRSDKLRNEVPEVLIPPGMNKIPILLCTFKYGWFVGWVTGNKQVHIKDYVHVDTYLDQDDYIINWKRLPDSLLPEKWKKHE